MTKYEAQLQQFAAALMRLEEVLAMPKSEIVRDSAIKRFEFTIDLCWKVLKTLLDEKHGIKVASPKECFREAYRQGIIEYDEKWLDLVDLRNETAHTYYQKTAEEVYEELPEAAKNFRKILNTLSK